MMAEMPFSKVDDDVFLRIALPRHLMTRIAQNKAVANQRRPESKPNRRVGSDHEISCKPDGMAIALKALALFRLWRHRTHFAGLLRS